MKRAGWLLLTGVAVLLTAHCASLGDRKPSPQKSLGAGFRYSPYGPSHDPGPDYWARFGVEMARRFEGAVPEAIWIVGRKNGAGTLLSFPASARDPFIAGAAEDANETALQNFDRLGYRVWLQVEPGHASVEELIDLVMTRYAHHPSVEGFGVDVEWYRSSSPDAGEAVSDDEARSWLDRVRRHGPNYRIFLKHWLIAKMPPTAREGILFVNDGQSMPGLEAMVRGYARWGRAFAPAPVAFQVGYRSDRPWWIRFDDPPWQIGRAILDGVPNTESLFWVDFTALEVFPPPTRPREVTTTTLAQRLGYPPDAKLLIVHADDLGMSRSVNAASVRALESGLVNSASIMVPCPSFTTVAAWARAHPAADLGLHLTLTSEWSSYRWGSVLPVNRVPSLLDERGCFFPIETTAAVRADAREAEAEVRAQIERARQVGLRPTHFDAHMRTLHMTPALFSILLRVSREWRIPAAIPASFLSDPALGPMITADDVVIDRFVTIEPEVAAEEWPQFYSDVIRTLQPGVTELVVHIAYDDEEMRAITAGHPNWGSAWRHRDFDFLTSDAFRDLLRDNGVKLVTWREIGKVMAPGS